MEVVVEQCVIRKNDWRTRAHAVNCRVGNNLKANVEQFDERTLIARSINIARLRQRLSRYTRDQNALTALAVDRRSVDDALVGQVTRNSRRKLEILCKACQWRTLRTTVRTVLFDTHVLKRARIELHLDLEAVDRKCFIRRRGTPAVLYEHRHEKFTLTAIAGRRYPDTTIRVIGLVPSRSQTRKGECREFRLVRLRIRLLRTQDGQYGHQERNAKLRAASPESISTIHTISSDEMIS